LPGRILAALGVLALLLAAPAHAQSLSPRAFTEAVAKAAREKIPAARVTVTGDLQMTIRYKDGTTTTSQLASAYKLYDGKADRLDLVISTFLSALARPGDVRAAGPAGRAPPPAQNPAFVPANTGPVSSLNRTRIVPLIKTQAWFDDMQRTLRGQGDELQFTDALQSGGLVIVYAEMSDAGTRYVTTRDDVGDPAGLPDLAIGNLRRQISKRIPVRSGPDGIYLVSDGDFGASILLVRELWASTRIDVDGDIVVAVPDNETLYVTGSKNPKGLAHLQNIAAEIAGEPDGLSPALFVLRDNRFVRLDAQ
jgi:hypothetical protein